MNQAVLNFRHNGTINRFKKEHPDFADKAEVIFEDLMRFFWASKKLNLMQLEQPHNEELDFLYIMDEEMKPIDQMWHVFLLYTKDYMDFCEKYFGEYLHHLPDIVAKLKGEFVYSLSEDHHAIDLSQEKYDPKHFERNLRRFLSFTYDLLGEDVLRRWYGVYLT